MRWSSSAGSRWGTLGPLRWGRAVMLSRHAYNTTFRRSFQVKALIRGQPTLLCAGGSLTFQTVALLAAGYVISVPKMCDARAPACTICVKSNGRWIAFANGSLDTSLSQC
jgi:hypothetical protein